MNRRKRRAVAVGAAFIFTLVAAMPAAAQGVDATTGATPPAPAGADAVSGATSGPAAARKGSFGFKDKVAFHRAAGWGSAGLLLAAGAVGAVRAYNLIVPAHDYRDSLGMEDEDEIDARCAAKIKELWSADQGLRWVHIGLVAAGEGLYLADAVTGIAWIDRSRPASNRAKLHRWAFYGHAAMMVAEIALGFLSTDALSRGDHELVSSLGVAHVAIGFAIPVAIGAAGLIETLPARQD